jgi:HD superfamily phosphohydrolase
MIECTKGVISMRKEDFRLDDVKLFDSKVFRDVIHGYVRVEHTPIWKLINTPQMQRLRRIKQLGGTYMVFPTAEHSRFVHSLGVYEIVRNIINLEQVKDHINDYEKLTVMSAGLLHDIGHGPFSHSFESAMRTNHEEMTVKIIKETEVGDILRDIHPDLPEDVANIIEHKGKPMLVQMVSSQCDSDRMDYLLRDSYACGVTYGQFDMSRILRTLRIVDDRIVFKESGVQAIEDYILARYHMYWQVYYHPTARSHEQLLYAIIRRIRDLYEEGYSFHVAMDYLEPLLKGDFSVEQYEDVDENMMLTYFTYFKKEKDAILRDLCTRYMDRHLLKYRTYHHKEDIAKIKALSDKEGYDSRYYVASDFTKNVPYRHFELGNNIMDIEILEEDGTIVTLPDKSEIVNAILHAKEKEDEKIFFVKELKPQVEEYYEKKDLL